MPGHGRLVQDRAPFDYDTLRLFAEQVAPRVRERVSIVGGAASKTTMHTVQSSFRQRRSGWRAARASSMRPMRVSCGAVVTTSGLSSISRTMACSAAA